VVPNTVPSVGFGLGTTINTGGGNDQVSVQGTTGTLFLNPGVKSSVRVGPNLDAIQGHIQINPLTNGVSLKVDDSAAASPHTYSIPASTILRSGAATITTLGSLSAVTLDVDSGGSSVDVSSSSAGTTTTVNGAPGAQDFFFVEASTNAIRGPVTF